MLDRNDLLGKGIDMTSDQESRVKADFVRPYKTYSRYVTVALTPAQAEWVDRARVETDGSLSDVVRFCVEHAKAAHEMRIREGRAREGRITPVQT